MLKILIREMVQTAVGRRVLGLGSGQVSSKLGVIKPLKPSPSAPREGSCATLCLVFITSKTPPAAPVVGCETLGGERDPLSPTSLLLRQRCCVTPTPLRQLVPVNLFPCRNQPAFPF